jgi:outer membrane protein assembly factor BamB
MNKFAKLSAFFLVTLGALAFLGIKAGDRMPYAIDKAKALSKIQPAPKFDMHVNFHGADILKFVDNEHLLIGSIKFDLAGKPVYGPLIMVHLPNRSELWRAPRESNYAARYDLVALQPNLVVRTAYKGKVVHSAYDPDSGQTLWENTIPEGDFYFYRFTPSYSLDNLFVVMNGKLTGIDARTGKQTWRLEVAGGLSETATKTVFLNNTLFIVGTKSIDAVRLTDGRHLWRRPNPIEKEFAVLTAPKGFFVYGGPKMAHFDESGKLGESWRSAHGDIRLIAPFREIVFVVSHDAEGNKDVLNAVISNKAAWSVALPGNVTSPLLQQGNSLYLTTALQEVERGDRTLSCINIKDKKISFSNALDSSPVHAEKKYTPLPDKLILRGKLLLVAREQQGITAVNPEDGRVVWKQPLTCAVREESLTLLNRVAPELNRDVKDKGGASVVESNLAASQSAQNLQMKYQNLMQTTGELTQNQTNLGNSASATAAGMHFDRSMAAAGTAIVAMNAMADISNTFWKAFGENLIRQTNLAARMKAVMGIQIAKAQYEIAFSRNFFIPPSTETIMMVDLNTGKHSDLTPRISMPNVPGRAWTMALSPDESMLAVVGVGLDFAHYTTVKRAMVKIPQASLIIYNTKDLSFVEYRKPAVARGVDTAGPAPIPATPVVDALYMIKAGYPPLVAYAMFGTIEDVRKAIASGEDVNAPYIPYGLTPLMVATNRGDVAIVKLLLDSGADVNATNVFKKTAYDNLAGLKDETVREEIRRLFDSSEEKQP